MAILRMKMVMVMMAMGMTVKMVVMGKTMKMMVMSKTVTMEALRFRNILDNLVAQLFVTDAMLDKNYMHV